ncbi:MAG: glycosyltransferase [Planctomycetes bacterium]|nr:glycosyltransferase [Planctomycetota bacterium]
MISVVVSTYEKPRHLALVLCGLAAQTDRDFETIVADDGSGPETFRVVETLLGEVPYPLQLVRQEHLGFRAARVRNLGIHASRGDYVVFLDGDCVPFPNFVACHRALRRPGRYLAGARYFLDRDVSAALTAAKIPRIAAAVPRPERRRLRALAWKDAFYRLFRLKEDRPKVVTSNLSVWKADLRRANGLDENFVGWGQEDEDLGRRLRRLGVRPRSAVGRANVCHIWHPTVESFRGRVRDGDNVPYYRRGYFLACCRNGLRKRALGEIRTRIDGLPPPLAAAFRARLADPGTSPPEVEILGPCAPRGASEVRVRVAGVAPGPTIQDAHYYILVPGPDFSPREEEMLRLAGARIVPLEGEGEEGFLAPEAIAASALRALDILL